MSINSQAPASGGYPRLAQFMAQDLGVYRRFGELNVSNILQLQAELVYLEKELKILIRLDDQSGDPIRSQYSKSAETLHKSVQGNDSPQWRKTLEVREKLKEYNAALLQQASINRLKPARNYDIRLIQSWIVRPEGGDSFLRGLEGDPWDEENESDLITVCTRQDVDIFTGWIAQTLLPWLHRIVLYRWKTPVKGHEDVGLVKWNNSYFTAVSRIITVIISTIFPSMEVLVLYFIQKMVVRVGMVLLFSATFSLSLAIFTNARPVEIFAATAAFASVQVVFVGSTSGTA
ncbi:hypothetical protein DL98DRAFT_649265 [Cadophora sp. DSE1049]|nr:hypothetical protein DL98DRAFT_649265 [Cadophora sp. DSE1049]